MLWRTSIILKLVTQPREVTRILPTDLSGGKKEHQRCSDAAASRRGCSVRGEQERRDAGRAIGVRAKERSAEHQESRQNLDKRPKNRESQCRKLNNRCGTAGKKRVRNYKEEGPTRSFKAISGEFRLREIYGDGNCMFRAISFIVWGTENRHRYLRSLVVSHIEDSWRELKSFVMAEWSMSSLNEYVAFMGADGTFASELECVIATKLNHLNLAIYRRTDTADGLRRILYSQYSGGARTANLLFSGHNEYGHYDVLLPI